MDTKPPHGYDYVEQSAEDSMRDTHALIHHIRNLDRSSNGLVQPILTPRFALSCSWDLLKDLKKFAASEPTLRIQTHLSENKKEVVETLERFKEADSYAGVYDFYGLLRENTILGHAVHVTKDEVKLIKDRGAGIAHCPTSNFNLNSGIAPVGYFLDMGVKVRFCSIFDEPHFYFFLGWVRHRCFWWIHPLHIKDYPKYQHRGQNTLIQEGTSSLFRVSRSSQQRPSSRP